MSSEKDTKEHIEKVGKYLREIIEELCNRSVNHDKSKLGPEEKPYFDEYTPKLAGVKYGTDEYSELLKGLKPALDHHYSENSHHPEHYEDGFKGMNLVDIVELLSDWYASTKRGKDGNIIESINKNQKRFKYSDDIKQILLNTVEYMEWK